MTKKEAATILKGDFSKVALQDGQSHADVFAAAFKMAIEILEQEKEKDDVQGTD